MENIEMVAPEVVNIYRAKPSSLKKFVAVYGDGDTTSKRISFGSVEYSDYTIHHDKERRRRYVERHSSGREYHAYSGRYTAGFWAMNLLWNKPSIAESARWIERKYKSIKIVLHL